MKVVQNLESIRKLKERCEWEEVAGATNDLLTLGVYSFSE